jgi:hypothetical protein
LFSGNDRSHKTQSTTSTTTKVLHQHKLSCFNSFIFEFALHFGMTDDYFLPAFTNRPHETRGIKSGAFRLDESKPRRAIQSRWQEAELETT